MKKTKIIIPALGLLVLSTAASVSGTVAWFSMNTTVTATGMTVRAQSSSTLLIGLAATTSNTNGRLADGASTQDVTPQSPATGPSLSPTSTVDGTNWFTATAAASNDEAAQAGTFSAVTANDLDGVRLASTFYIQAFDATKPTSATYTAFTGKKVIIDSITVSYTTADALSSSFRVLAVCGSEKVFCGPTSMTPPSNQGVASVSEGNATKSNITFATVSAIASNKATLSANNDIISTINYNQVYTVNVYVYFDGEDPNCFTDNIPATLNDYVVGVSFSLANVA